MERALLTLRGWVEAAHPFPLAAVLCLTALIGFSSSADGNLDARRFALVLLMTGTAAGLAYDLWFKETRWSWAPFLVAFAVLPLFVWSSLDLFRTELLAVYVVGIALVPAVHLANVLPDMEADIAAQRRNLAVIFGREKSLRVLAVCLNLPLVLVVCSLPVVRYNLQVLSLVLLAYMAMLLVVALLYWRREDALAFKAVVVAAVLFAGGWLTAV